MSDEQTGHEEEGREKRGSFAKGAPKSKMSIDDLERLKKVLGEHPLIKWAIYFAGFGGLMDGLHVLWKVVKFFAALPR
jgi:hypothetical protein